MVYLLLQNIISILNKNDANNEKLRILKELNNNHFHIFILIGYKYIFIS